MSIDLSQDLYWCRGGKITLMKHGHNIPIFINGEDTQDFSYNIRWLHLSESKPIDVLYKNIQVRIHSNSTFTRKHSSKNILRHKVIAFLTLTLGSLMELTNVRL